MSALLTLADEYYAYRQTTDINRHLWDCSLEQLEHWEAVAPDAVTDRQERLREFGDRADALEIDERDPMQLALRDSIAFTARSKAHQLTWDAELQAVNPAMGLIPLAMVFISRFPLRTDEHGEQYLRKMSGLAPLVDDLVAALQAAALDGRVALTRHLSASADALDAYMATPVAAGDALTAQAPPVESSDPDGWSRRLAGIVEEEVRPALRRYVEALRALAERGRDDDHPGLVHLEGGLEHYRDLVWAHTTLPLEPAEVHQLGLEVVTALEEEYRELAGPLLGTTDNAEIYARLRDDEEMHYRSGEDIVRDATRALERANEAAPEWFAHLPRSECVAVAITSGPVAFYSAPSADGSKPGEFFFNAADPSAWSTYELEAITYHESIPGHHLQFALHTESTTLHPVLRHLNVTAYLEGWGLYTERLADEMGLYTSDLSRVGMLAADSLRACRLVVDTGLHALRWTRQEAIDYMAAHCPLSIHQITAEVDRYIGLPGQALAYMIGRREIQAIRREAEPASEFDIREFHDQVLRHGMVPLTTLRALVLG
ncbi:DUF885 domain-containing protein [Demequina aestuarii]|uniref:DUF885 domain-containing protein n=1 Tax=Demequina aestuarii TaxID=327095 RepID=UPI000783F3BA|nr:DUF885 domain-containing protein [Demequina aestuarii]